MGLLSKFCKYCCNGQICYYKKQSEVEIIYQKISAPLNILEVVI